MKFIKKFDKLDESSVYPSIEGYFDQIKDKLPDDASDFCLRIKEELSTVPYISSPTNSIPGFYIDIYDVIIIEYYDNGETLKFDIQSSFADISNYITAQAEKDKSLVDELTVGLENEEQDDLFDYYIEEVLDEFVEIMRTAVDDLCLHPDFHRVFYLDEEEVDENIIVRRFKQKIKIGDLPWHKKKEQI